MADSLMARLDNFEKTIKEVWMGMASHETVADLIREYRAAAKLIKEMKGIIDGEWGGNYENAADWLTRNGVKGE